MNHYLPILLINIFEALGRCCIGYLNLREYKVIPNAVKLILQIHYQDTTPIMSLMKYCMVLMIFTLTFTNFSTILSPL